MDESSEGEIVGIGVPRWGRFAPRLLYSRKAYVLGGNVCPVVRVSRDDEDPRF